MSDMVWIGDQCYVPLADWNAMREKRDEARRAARRIWADLGDDLINTEDGQLVDPVECWPWLEVDE